jgi:hypothetical protein
MAKTGLFPQRSHSQPAASATGIITAWATSTTRATCVLVPSSTRTYWATSGP